MSEKGYEKVAKRTGGDAKQAPIFDQTNIKIYKKTIQKMIQNRSQKKIEHTAKSMPNGTKINAQNHQKGNAKTCIGKDHEHHQKSCFCEG